MATFIDSRLINLSSQSADLYNNGTSLSDVVFSFVGLLQNEENILYSQISVMNAQIPISYYIINEYNNTLNYSVNNINYTVSFALGNYNANSFITEFLSKMNGFNCSLNRITGKLTFTYYKSFKFLSSSTCFKVLGFLPYNDYISVNNSLTGTSPCNFFGMTRLRIASTELLTYTMDSFIGNYSDTLQTINVNSGSFGILLYDNTQKFKAILRNKVINYFDIKLYDDDNNLVDFNGVHWNITLQLDITRQLNSFIGNISDIPQPVQQTQDNQDNQDNQAVDLPISTGDNDLDLLLYENNIYQ